MPKNPLDRLPRAALVIVAILGATSFQLLLGTSYVAASLDPVGESVGLPMALVNEDEGPHGETLVRLVLQQSDLVAWRVHDTRDAAIDALEAKRAHGALVIPRDFSAHLESFATDAPTQATLETILNPGASTSGNVVAQRVLAALVDAAKTRVREEALQQVEIPTLGVGALTLEQARWIAEPIRAQSTTVNAVPDNGANGLAPTYLAMAAWIGGYIGAVAFERFGDKTRLAPSARALVMMGAAAAQAGASVILLAAVGMSVPDPMRLFAVLALGTWMAYAVVTLLLDLLGIPGVVPAFAILALGLPASGAVYPASMLPPFFRAIHDASPFTWLVESLRTTLYAPAATDVAPYGTRLALLAGAAVALTLALASLRARKAAASTEPETVNA